MKRYLLDTNTVSYCLKGQAPVLQRLTNKRVGDVGVSVITQAELLYGLAKRPTAKKLHLTVHELLKRLDVIVWSTHDAQVYGSLRAEMERQGKPIGALDLLIATQVMARNQILVTSGKAFHNVPDLSLEDWTI